MLPVAFSASRLPPSVPTNITPLPACAGVDEVNVSAAVYDHVKYPRLVLKDCIALPTGMTTAPSDDSDVDALVGAPSSALHRIDPDAPSHTDTRVSFVDTPAADTTPASGSTSGATVLALSSGALHLTAPVWPTSATSVLDDVA